jgi:hypothetical protein
VQTLLIKASEDEKALESDCLSDSIRGFHSQQAVEKLLKALLSARSIPFALTHDLGRLEILVVAAGEILPATPLALGDLSDFAVVYRYDLLFQYS